MSLRRDVLWASTCAALVESPARHFGGDGDWAHFPVAILGGGAHAVWSGCWCQGGAEMKRGLVERLKEGAGKRANEEGIGEGWTDRT